MGNAEYERFISDLRSALNHLYDPYQLRRSSLASQFGLNDRPDAASSLHRMLTEAIQSLEPGPEEPPQSRAWRIHDVLFYGYVRQLSSDKVSDQLGLSGRQLRREQRAGLESLAEALWSNRHPEQEPIADAASPAEALTEVSTLHDLAWLTEALPDSSTSIVEELSQVLQLARHLAAGQDVRLRENVSGDLPELAVPPVAFRQMILNLLTVAIPRAGGGVVEISARLTRWEVEFQVSVDSKSLFPSPLPKERTGLDLVTEMARLCGGQAQVDIGKDPISMVLTLPALGHLPVLVLDDNADALQLFQRYVAGTRYHVAGSRHSDRVMDLVKEVRPQIIVLDVMMPQVDGWYVLGQLRQDQATRCIPVVVCTILPQEILAQALGVDAFVRKPVSRADFIHALDSVSRSFD